MPQRQLTCYFRRLVTPTSPCVGHDWLRDWTGLITLIRLFLVFFFYIFCSFHVVVKLDADDPYVQAVRTGRLHQP